MGQFGFESIGLYRTGRAPDAGVNRRMIRSFFQLATAHYSNGECLFNMEVESGIRRYRARFCNPRVGSMMFQLDDVNQYLTIHSDSGLFLVLIPFD